MKTCARCLVALLLIAGLAPLLPAGSIRLPTGHGHTVRIKGHPKALRSHAFTLSGPGFSASRVGREYSDSCN